MACGIPEMGPGHRRQIESALTSPQGKRRIMLLTTDTITALSTGTTPADGYYLGGPTSDRLTVQPMLADHLPGRVASWLSRLPAPRYVGRWTDPATGVQRYDACTRHESWEAAWVAGANRERTIYSVTSGTIRVAAPYVTRPCCH